MLLKVNKPTARGSKYSVAPKDASNMALRKLDRRAKLPANAAAYAVGVISCLALGCGMCLSMGVIGGGAAAPCLSWA